MITDDIELAVQTLTNGDLLAFPTETVYGLGARADSASAVNKIFESKERPSDHPLISHCATKEKAFSAVKEIPEYAHVLADAFWPGPMTLILKSNEDGQIAKATRGGHSSVAIRVPQHKLALELLFKCNFFVAAPSANKFGRVSPTKPEHVQSEFKDILILDGEQSQCGLESTIISCLGDKPEILREGFISKEEIESLGIEVQESQNKVAAPGTLEKHYMPSVPVITVASISDISDSKDSSLIALINSESEVTSDFKLMSLHKTMEDFAYELYSFFRESELANVKNIYVVRPPMEGVGAAINDRVTKAASSGVSND